MAYDNYTFSIAKMQFFNFILEEEGGEKYLFPPPKHRVRTPFLACMADSVVIKPQVCPKGSNLSFLNNYLNDDKVFA